ncbi:MAG: PadR family transcriptional regulator [Bacteroidales bacterium]|jgi:PadR family transcriptional regulator PadR|nr:PadR family transcriptional regulator [Bacteroidales bacterium]
MKEERTYTQMKKGVLEMCILSVISKSEVYTSDIIKVLHEADLVVVEGTVYPLLSRLKNDGMLTYRWEESTSGPPRKYFSITPAGQDLLIDLLQNWQSLSQSVEQIIHNKIEPNEINS